MPRPDDHTRRQATLPPLAWAALFGAGFLLLLLVAGIATQIVILQDSRNHIRAQDAKLALAVSAAREAAPKARATARQVVPLIRDARPVVRQIGEAIDPLSTATESLPRLVRNSQAVARYALPVLSDVARVDVAHILEGIHTATDAALYRARLARALDATNEMLDRVRSEDLIRLSARAARDAPQLVRLQRRLLRVQIATLKTQRQSLETQLTTLAVQQEALVHIRSIDRKTGGTAPAQGAPVPTP
jgi:hypothetical protein